MEIRKVNIYGSEAQQTDLLIKSLGLDTQIWEASADEKVREMIDGCMIESFK